ncbi:MAG: hypothetical protein RQ868_10890 [Meiothermus sp.]|uniref:hypothetical protein n=1 Tax=Meiothermus sp. TaxID=1955249 RepID=UPI0028CD6F9B|nr:hypothetical protein [Meiothermus sp.]MDT7921079.1 hypothetical protein [Meiothermus sp.]
MFIPNQLAPGVYINVVFTPEPLIGLPEKYNALFFIVAEKGPANKPVYITSAQRFLDTFGQPDPKFPLTSLYAYEYVRNGGPAYVVRLLPRNATKANATLALVPDPVDVNTYVWAYGYVDYSTNTFIGRDEINDRSVSLPVSATYAPPEPNKAVIIAQFGEYGMYYNTYRLRFSLPLLRTNKTFNVVIERVVGTQTENVAVFNGVTFEPNVNELGYPTQINHTLYTFNQLAFEYLKTNYTIKYKDYETNTITDTNTRPIDSVDIVYSTNTIWNFAGGSDGGLRDPLTGLVNFSLFADLVIEAVYGYTTLLPNRIQGLIDDETIFIKYIVDPCDERFPYTKRRSVWNALVDLAQSKYMLNAGAIVLSNIADLFDWSDIGLLDPTNPPIPRHYLHATYYSKIEDVDGKIYPHLRYVVQNIARLRAQQQSIEPLAGVINATITTGVDVIPRLTVPERSRLVELGINFAHKDPFYGVFTDLDRTTSLALGKFLYVIEDVVDIKRELVKLLRPFVHKLETYDWESVKSLIIDFILKPRVASGLIKEYEVNLRLSEELTRQNVLGIDMNLRYAREIERIAVTIYVR